MTTIADTSVFSNDAAIMVHGGSSLEAVAAKHGIDAQVAMDLIVQNEVDINRIAAEMSADGRDIQIVAQKTLGVALRQLAVEAEAGNLNHSMLLRTVEVLNKVSGLEAKHKQGVEEKSRLIFRINFGNEEKVIFDDVIDCQPVEVPGDN